MTDNMNYWSYSLLMPITTHKIEQYPTDHQKEEKHTSITKKQTEVKQTC